MADTTYVIDTEPLIAFLYEEPGYEMARDILSRIEAGDIDGAIAEVIALELLYKVARIEGEDGTATPASLQAAEWDIRVLERRELDIERVPWRLAGEIKADGGLSLADAYAVALAVEQDVALLVGADEDFDVLLVDIPIERIHEEGVELGGGAVIRQTRPLNRRPSSETERLNVLFESHHRRAEDAPTVPLFTDN